MKLPGPDHPIAIVPNKNRVRVIFDGKVIADTTNALTLTEASYKPVQYIPRGDVDMAQLVPTRHATHCPYKGDASYFTIKGSNGKGENAVWSYETPFSAVAPIAGHLAFYRNRVHAIEEMPS